MVPTRTSDFISLGLIFFVCKAGMFTRPSWFPGVKARCYPAVGGAGWILERPQGAPGPHPWPCPYFAALFSSMFKVPGKRWAGVWVRGG